MAHGRRQTKHGTMRDANSTDPIRNAPPRHDALKCTCDVYKKLTPIRVAIRSSEGKFSGLDPEPTHLPAILSSMPLT